MGGRTPRAPAIEATLDPAVKDWLQEVVLCLSEPGRPLAKPSLPELRPAYEAILLSRQRWEETQHDLIESIQMQCLQTVGSILAHDLHNLSLRLALLGQNLEQFYGDPAFLQSAKRVLDDTVERMQALVEEFRERHGTVIVKILTDVGDLLSAVVRQSELCHLEGLRLEEEYSPAINRIWADPFFLGSAFRVLVENAVQAMPGGGRLTLRTRSISNGGARVEIEDSGVGMTRDFIARELFAPFRSGKGRGLGLGMYICKHIIELHDGEIQVHSERGRGTRCVLVFPKGLESK